MKFYHVVLLWFVIFSFPVNANYSCTGKVAHLGMDSALRVSNGFGVHELCSFSDAKCSAWLSLALSTKMAGKEFKIYYLSSTISGHQESDACKNIGNWVKPADEIYYVETL
ncbi:hypothetical protein L4D13_07775 [Photobacterium profundum]|uniref:hypothetical protein n=1 Tax=Photobacterium profundum TaxID=74109 RepID=UPI003D11DF2E